MRTLTKHFARFIFELANLKKSKRWLMFGKGHGVKRNAMV